MGEVIFMKKAVVSFICILIVLGAVGAVFAGRSPKRDFLNSASQSDMVCIADGSSETVYDLLGVYID